MEQVKEAKIKENIHALCDATSPNAHLQRTCLIYL